MFKIFKNIEIEIIHVNIAQLLFQWGNLFGTHYDWARHGTKQA